jgi:hypothetical protein
MGVQPMEFDDVVKFTLDYFPYLRLNAVEDLNTALNVNTIGLKYPVGFAPDVGEIWLVSEYSVNLVTIAGEYADFWGVRNYTSGGPSYNITPEVVSGTAAGIGNPQTSIEQPFFLPNGARLGALVKSIATAGNISFGFNARILRFRG